MDTTKLEEIMRQIEELYALLPYDSDNVWLAHAKEHLRITMVDVLIAIEKQH